MLPPLSDSMTKRYLPQYNQFGFNLEQQGAGFTGRISSSLGQGSAWVMPVSEHCLVLEHNIVPARDMQLFELTPEPYACVSEASESTLECMPEAHIKPTSVKSQPRTPLANPVCTFVQHECGEGYSPLKEGHLYYSRSIILEPGYFKELEQRYPGQFGQLFDAFGNPWNDLASHALCTAIHSLSAERCLRAGAHLHAQSTIGAMVAELAADASAAKQARARQGDKSQKQLAAHAAALIEHELRSGNAPTLGEVAEKLYVSRSTLCAVFKQETGTSIGAFTRKKRALLAEELLLAGNMSIAQIAAHLGFSRQTSFSQAFKQEHGMSPTEWKTLNR